MTEQEKPLASIGISLSVDVSKGRNMVFQTYVERDCNDAWLNTLLDKLNRAADRQWAIYELEEATRRLMADEVSFEDITTKMMMIEEREKQKVVDWANSGRRGDFKRAASEQTHYDQLVENLKRQKMIIEKEREIVAELKKKAAA